MSDIVIKVENLSKQYRLGELGTGTLSHDLNRWWHKIRGKEDPYLKIGETNDRSTKGNSEYVWALRDINFEVKQGEVLGIIGKNGAGKSTLLKLLSRVTSPTTGNIKAKGRIASLLEVGTGFHEELTGRENIFLNGAILGMSKAEIRSKLDEIIAFSGTERYIDTPVKRYSSGMRVRLAFAVAAHLDPEILIVDEVLAVGDAEFQSKAIGKMQDISKGGGRTVLFVSHNMKTIRQLCENSILLHNGQLSMYAKTDDIINHYLNDSTQLIPQMNYAEGNYPGNEFAKLVSVSCLNKDNVILSRYDVSDNIRIQIKYIDTNKHYTNTAIIHIKNEKGDLLFASNEFNNGKWKTLHKSPCEIVATCNIPKHFLAEGKFYVLVAIGNYNPNMIHLLIDNVVSFEVIDQQLEIGAKGISSGIWPGLIRPKLEWDIQMYKNGN